MERQTFKFKTNVPAKILFQFSEPKTGTGQYGEWYLYGVQINGQDMGLFASKGLQDKLSQLGELRGKLLEITKVEGDDNRTFWQIKNSAGEDITPGYNQNPTPAPKTPQNANFEPTADITELVNRLNKAAQVIKDVLARLDKIESDVAGLKAIIPDDKMDAFELGASYKPGIPIGKETPAEYPEVFTEEETIKLDDIPV